MEAVANVQPGSPVPGPCCLVEEAKRLAMMTRIKQRVRLVEHLLEIHVSRLACHFLLFHHSSNPGGFAICTSLPV
jgi:hypothetical protein